MKKIVLITTTLIFALGVSGFYLIQKGSSAVSADQVKAEIIATFKDEPAHFRISEASKALSAAVIEGGYQICANNSQALSESYVEVSKELDSLGGEGANLRFVINQATAQPGGMSDCDLRVIQTLIKDLKQNQKSRH